MTFVLLLPPKLVLWFVAVLLLTGLSVGLIMTTLAYFQFTPFW